MATERKSGKPTGKATSKPKPPTKAKGYRGIVKGSRKEAVAKLFDQHGPERAIAEGLEMGLKEGTLKSWFGTWRRQDKAKPKAKAA